MSVPRASRSWFWAAVALTAAKLWLVSGLRVYAIGPSFHDDRLFIELAEHLMKGEWLGPYTQFTLAKGPMYSMFIAAAFKLGVPLFLAQHLLYAAACGVLTWSLRPWLRAGAARFTCYTVLLWNPMSYEAENLGRVLRQNLYVPLAILTVAGLITLFARRHERAWRQAVAGGAAGLAFGAFWLTREESLWLVPAVGLLLLAPALALRRELAQRWRALGAGVAAFVVLAGLPLLFVSAMNLRHYGWFGTVEFRAPEFNDAYGALLRVQSGPKVEHVTITRQTREKAYELSPAFARLRPAFEGTVGQHWADPTVAPVGEFQIRGGWFMWALRDAVREAGLAPDAGAALRYYGQVAAELNAACDAGRVAALPRRSGFLPPLGPELARPILENTILFTDYFFRFRDFTARAPASEGDYADLKPFRNFVGTRLSPAPRSPELPTPEQDRRDAWKVAVLERIGQATATVFGWLGPLLLAVGLLRGMESAFDRRVSFMLGLAAALLVSCTAYVAINILIQVTSFFNMTPAALAAAYPLYLVAAGAIAVDAVASFRNRAATAPATAAVPVGPAARTQLAWLPACGVALAVFGARLALIHHYASDVPYNDQWVIEAEQILVPWLNGTLGLRDFFIPHFEHLPVFTRFLAWLQVAVTGRWDPLVQMTVNAALYAGFIALAARWVWANFRPVAAGAATLLLLLGGGLPHAWENTAWGFQSQFPLALILMFVHVAGACTHPAGSRGWWLAQAAAGAALFTLASTWVAPLAVVISWLWTGPRRRQELLVPGVIAAAGALLLWIVHRFGAHTFVYVVASPSELFHSALHLLGWPSPLPGAVALVQLPWLVHALRLRGRTDTAPVDRVILVLGLWGAAQAAAIAFGRAGDNSDFVSRYGDLFFVSTLAGALALARLAPAGGRERTAFLAASVLWSVVVVGGLVRDSTEGHALYFQLHAAERRETGRTAVQNYLRSGDRTVLDSRAGKAVFLEDTPLVGRLLDDPKLRALLPPPVNPATAPDAVGSQVRALQAHWNWLMLAGVLVLAAGAGTQAWRNRHSPAPAPLVPAADPWRWRVAAVIGLTALVMSMAWSNPLLFDPARRWQRCLGAAEAIHDLRFTIVGPSEYGPERLQGAAMLQPVPLRNQFYGTAPDGPSMTGTVLSSPFALTKPWLVVPYSGYPVGNGNGLRLRVLDAQGNQAGNEIGCDGPNTDGVLFWTVDTHALIGRRVQLVLYDGRTAGEGWVAAAAPIPTSDPTLAETLARRLAEEQKGPVRIAVLVIAGVALLCALLGWLGHRRAVRVASPL